MSIQLKVTMANGNTHTVTVDGRDFARLEANGMGQELPHNRGRFLAWSAMLRDNLTKANFEEFAYGECVEVADADEDGEGEQGLDPGQTTPNATSASRSRARATSRSQRPLR